jgi:putative Mg2+ transporter-C (MgtC) family protein
MELTIYEMLFRILLAFILSLSFGLERQLTKKPVGFGVFTLVSTGTCMLAIIALTLGGDSSPLPLLGGAITGIGFLGAGAIIRYQERAFGFTTAASIWAFAAIGMGVGLGLFEAVFLFYLLVIVIILLDHTLEDRGLGNYYQTVVLVFDTLNKFKEIRHQIQKNHKIISMDFDTEKQRFTLSFLFSGHRRELEGFVEDMAENKGVVNLRVE